ncbi:hypothetical protein TUM19329_35340 [Legionella antarctica]|uniref:Coiled-coil protein n=1 Tax=Legionella antarctica TaxID=2708020 RepID=A0A6F8TAA2_9GAMM|nr:hypothetical protein [Legionella antarctica]BCA97173.1 hypothetical protein TUM19329_35340 [Legionella antarctica]
MVYSSQNAAVGREKHRFFVQFSSAEKLDNQLKAINTRTQNIGYTYLLRNQNALETEFTNMFVFLQQQDDEKKDIFWLYCYYCASLLEAFYKAYSQHGNAEKYRLIRQQIKERLNHDKITNEAEESFIQSLENSFLQGFRNLVNSPFHLSKIRDYVAYSNLCRIYWVFCRLTIVQGLSVAKDLIEMLDTVLGAHTDIEKITGVLQAPNYYINYLSVGFFLIRFMIDGGLLLRHTFFPTEQEKGAENSCEVIQLDDLPGAATLESYRNTYIMVPNEYGTEIELYYIPQSGSAEKLKIKNKNKLQRTLLDKLNKEQSIRLFAEEVRTIITEETGHVPESTTPWDRFKYEIYKRHCNFANDLVWATVNFLTNFNQVVHISGPVAGYLTSAFLVFDVCMILYKCNLAKQEYLTKKAQYIAEKDEYSNPDRFRKLTPEQRQMHIEMLDQQLLALKMDWLTKEATFYFVAAAAALLVMGFTASMLLGPAVMIAGCYFACIIAVAMYLSADSYSKYQEKNLYLEQSQQSGKNLSVALKEYEAARNDFIFTMVKNTVMPLIMITTFAICWPAAIVLTVMYAGYELYHAYDQHSESKVVKQLALTGPQEESDESHLLQANATFQT